VLCHHRKQATGIHQTGNMSAAVVRYLKGKFSPKTDAEKTTRQQKNVGKNLLGRMIFRSFSNIIPHNLYQVSVKRFVNK
jgi:hypothetical protein